MAQLTYSARLIFPNNDAHRVMEILEMQRLAFNACSEARFALGSKNSIVELHGIFYRNFRTCQPEIPSQVVIRAERDVLNAYRVIKSNKHKITEPAQKKKLSMRLDKRLFTYKNGILRLTASSFPRVKAQIQLYPRLEALISKYRFCDPLLTVKNGEIWIAITFEIGETIPAQTLACGVDLGVRVFAATSEGVLYVDKKHNARRRKIRFFKRKLQSSGSKSAKRKLKQMRRKERNMSQDFTHRLANAILNNTPADVIAVEDLEGLKNGKKGKRATTQVPFAELRRILQYKAALLPKPKTVISVKPHHTSQIDSRSGKRVGERRGRCFYAKDGKILDADVNAAINIANRSKLPVSHFLLPSGEKRLLSGQVVITQPNVWVKSVMV